MIYMRLLIMSQTQTLIANSPSLINHPTPTTAVVPIISTACHQLCITDPPNHPPRPKMKHNTVESSGDREKGDKWSCGREQSDKKVDGRKVMAGV